MQSTRWFVLVALTVAFSAYVPAASKAQDPPPPTLPAPAAQSSSSNKSQNQKYSHANDFLVIGTVFNDKGFAFPGAELKIRRSNEKKFRWDSYTNSRGEFAVRVPKGSDYEMIVHAKGFADQAKTLDAKTGLSEARIVVRMESGGGEKK
jgi:hypothetical protein